MGIIEVIPFGGWERCYRLANEQVELIVTAEVGPRILHFALLGEENVFAEFREMWGQTGGDQWRAYGGHRLWHAPEQLPRTYYPDNHPVTMSAHDGFVRFTQPLEETTGIQKEIDIYLEDRAAVQVVHRLTNRGMWPVQLAPWALSVMAAGGTAVLPLPPRGSHPENLLPTTSLAIWPYTDMQDARWTWGEKYLLLRQDTAATKPQKIGLACLPGWVAYWRNGYLFTVQFAHIAGASYPDLGSSAEVFTDSSMLEVETLGPLTELAPGTAVEHVEKWQLHSNVPALTNDEDVEAAVGPLLE